jgi:hypothetical protein
MNLSILAYLLLADRFRNVVRYTNSLFVHVCRITLDVHQIVDQSVQSIPNVLQVMHV